MRLRTKFEALMAVVLLSLLPWQAKAVVSAGEYYIVNDFFDKALTANSSNAPRLTAYDSSNDAAFIFVAEASGTSGYVKLKHKSTGLYLTASTANEYSVLLSSSGSGDQYLWALDQRFSTTIVSKKSTSKRLGCDFSSSGTYYWTSSVEVPVYYNKGAGALNWFTVIPSNGNGYEASRKVTKTTSFTNDYGVLEQDDYQVGEAVTVNGLDYHIISSTPFDGGSVNLVGRNSWLIFEDNIPSNVISNHLGNVTINGASAVNGTNCRVEIWLRGAVVIPLTDEAPLVATTDNGTFDVALGNTTNLGENSNKMRSFTLKRGYMVTLATGTSGGDYSRVYVADHADLTVTLPTSMDRRVSSAYVRNWHYTSKCGYGRTSEMWNGAKALRASWAWNWDANSSSSSDIEYIPIKQHLYWPGDGNFYNSSYTAMMLFNEPEHSEQHTSDKCSCGGTISAWTAYTQTGKHNGTGLRIGSPSATDLSYIKSYLDYCDNMKQRCDFSCTHGYWTTEWSSSLSTLAGYGRPIWITEWEYGASWTTSYTPSSTDEYAGKVLGVLDQLEYNDWVERYAYYPDDLGGTNGWMREVFWDNTYYKGTAPAGTVYKKIKPHFGYNSSKQHVTNWWAPSASATTISSATLQDGQYVLTVKNPNGDATATFEVQKQLANGTWTTVGSITNRNEFDATTTTFMLPTSVVAGDVVRVVTTTLFNSEEKISNEFTLMDYRSLETLQNLRFDEGTFLSSSVHTYAKDITGSNVAQMQEVTGWSLGCDNGDARASGQYRWGSGLFVGGSGYNVPASDSEGSSAGGALGMCGVWTGQIQYVQAVVLSAGTYTITVPVYNVAGTGGVSKNLIGFIADDGTEYLATTTSFAVNTWTTVSVSFRLTKETLGRISVGVIADNIGSGSAPHLFADYVNIDYTEIPSLGDITNLTFDYGTFLANSVHTYAKDITGSNVAQMQPVDDWYIEANGDTRASGQYAWGSNLFVGGDRYTVPATDQDGSAFGGALGLVAVWTGSAQYRHLVKLPAGNYTITVPAYNAGSGTSAVSKNLVGFVAGDGTEYLATETSFAANAWTTMTISFTLEEETTGYLSVGYTATNSGSGNMPHLFYDYMKITRDDRIWPMVGDADGDGTRSFRDVPGLISVLLEAQPTNYERNDMNKDGRLNLQDLDNMLQFFLTK